VAVAVSAIGTPTPVDIAQSEKVTGHVFSSFQRFLSRCATTDALKRLGAVHQIAITWLSYLSLGSIQRLQ